MSSIDMRSFFTVSPRDLPRHIATLFEAGLVPFVRSSPGKGKSALFQQFAEDFKLVLLDIRLSMYESSDFSGLPFRNEGRTEYLPTSLFPLDTDEVPTGMNGFLILLDEYNHAEPEMIRASYKLILDRMVGEHKLHPQAYVALAGNNVDDNALANNTGTALNSRVTHLILGSDLKHWLEDVAPTFNCDHRIIGFLSANPDKLNDFDPDQEETSFCCERTWHKVANLLNVNPSVEEITPLIAGTITPGVAAEFIQFCAIYKNLVKLEDVIANPLTCNLPDDSPTRWALTTHLAKSIDTTNARELFTYVNRLPMQYVVIFLSMLKGRLELFRIPEGTALLGRMGRAV